MEMTLHSVEAMSMDPSRYQTIYPTYLDSTKTVKMGRRIAASDAVENPTVNEIGEALRALRMRHVVQPYKGYSRDTESRWDNPGRVLVDLRGDPVPNLMPGVTSDDNMNSMNDGQFTTKKDLLKEIAKIIPSLHIRIQRLEEEKKQAEEAKKKEKEMQLAKSKAPASGGAGVSGTTSRKKKGKKKR